MAPPPPPDGSPRRVSWGRSTEDENRKPSASGRVTGFKGKNVNRAHAQHAFPVWAAGVREVAGPRPARFPRPPSVLLPSSRPPAPSQPRASATGTGTAPRGVGPPQPEPEPEPPRASPPARAAWAASRPPEQRGGPAAGQLCFRKSKRKHTTILLHLWCPLSLSPSLSLFLNYLLWVGIEGGGGGLGTEK